MLCVRSPIVSTKDTLVHVPLLNPSYVILVMLIFARVSGLMIAAPVFSQQNIPVQIRVLLSILLAYTIAGLVPGPLPPHSDQALGLILAAMQEVLIGLIIGFTAQFVFWSIQFAGELIGFQMALRMAQVFDPIGGFHSNPIGRLLTMVMTLIFLILDGHHLILEAFIGSYQVIPLAGAHYANIATPLLEYTGHMFQIALRLAAPFMVTLYIIDVALGVFVRAVPRADIFAIALPLKLLTGLIVAYLFMERLIPIIPGLVDTMYDNILRIIEVIAPA